MVIENKCSQDEEELQHMNNVWNQRLEKLERADNATAKIIKWLKTNQQKFNKPILEPVCMSLNILEPGYTKQAEAFFLGRDFFSFIAQTEEDKETFLKEASL